MVTICNAYAYCLVRTIHISKYMISVLFLL